MYRSPGYSRGEILKGLVIDGYTVRISPYYFGLCLGRPKPQQSHDRKMNLMKMVRVSIAPTCLDHQTLNNSYLLLPINRLQTEMETCRTSKSTMKPAEPEGIQSRRCGHSRFTVIFDHGRTASCPAAPVQIPACGTTARGSSKLLASHIRWRWALDAQKSWQIRGRASLKTLISSAKPFQL